jgi:predicted HAD superfamily Cof-like phosphohydrolase
MKACDQTTGEFNNEQFTLYLNLIREEYNELFEANAEDDRLEMLDALIDILVVTIGAIHSMGSDAEGAWKEVMSTNFAKIGEDGKVRKREDGKVLKPQGWVAPNLAPFVERK